jgi:hypothetical protein
MSCSRPCRAPAKRGRSRAARFARNDVALDLTLAFDDTVGSCDPRVLERIRENATVIARADFYVAVMSDAFNDIRRANLDSTHPVLSN